MYKCMGTLYVPILIFNGKLRERVEYSILFYYGGVYMNYWGIFFCFVFLPALIIGLMVVTYISEKED